jgi:transglutaminase-like putative cysteine protease
MLKKIAGLALIIISVSLLSSFISSLDFSKTGFEGLIGKGDFGGGNSAGVQYPQYSTTQGEVFGGEGSGGGFASLSDSSSTFNPPNVPLFFVEGLNPETNYLRLYTATRYENGKWVEDKGDCSQESIPIARKFKLTPIVELNRYLPVSKDTKGILPVGENIERCYNAATGTFRINATRSPYYGFTTAKSFKPTSFMGTASYPDLEIRALAEKITANATSDLEKVKAIESYLKNNYINTYVERTDVKEFLFKTKRGTAREFATAFVLLAQSIGIPARAVFGYLADPVETNQTIFASDAYVWAEVRFKEGWMEFDPAPEGRGINTTTAITYIDSKLVAGENFTVRGYVEDEFGNDVSGYVEIFLKKDKKSREGILAGVVPVKNGKFEAVLKVPEVTGRYSVQAHFTGTLYHMESWSDPEVEIYYRPTFNVTLPSRVPEWFTLSGKLESSPPFSGQIHLCVDGSCRKIEVVNGNFREELSLAKGKHEIALIFKGMGYLLPAEFRKEVEAGEVSVAINEAVGEGEDVTGVVYFNGQPVNATVRIGNVTVKAVNGNFSAKLPLNLGKNELKVEIPDLLYSETKIVYMKEPVEIKAQKVDGKLRVIVLDKDGNPADGFVEVDGVKKELLNGMAEFEVENPKLIVYSGSERYFPAIKEFSSVTPFILIPVAVAAISVGALLAYRMLFRVEKIDFFVEKEHPELPNIWDVGETVKIRLSEPAFVRYDGFEEFTDTITLTPEKFGTVRVQAFRVDGRKRKRGEIEIKVAPYSKGIAEIVRKIDEIGRKRLGRVESMTAREVMEKLGVRAEVLLNYFERGVYGGEEYTRRDFLEAFYDYLRVVGDEA